MKKLKKLPFFIALLSVVSTISVYSEESFIPKPPSLNASNYILMDSVSGRILAEYDSDERIEPASITKIMTGYVAADQIAQGFVSLEDEVLISENCWRKGGSKMFIREGTKVLFSDLIKGMVIQSGNDASCAIAEHVAISEEGFVELMQLYIEEMGMENTQFKNVSGWPDPEHYSSAKDLAILTKNLIDKFPDHYAYKKDDINNLIFDANNRNLKLITTEKDYVKITENKNHIHFLPIELELSVKDKLNFELFLQEKLNA